MNYKRLYDSIIFNASLLNRSKGGDEYFEKHHIIPRCLGGDDAESNIILLTAKEHFVCHHLLAKIYNNPKLDMAFAKMCYRHRLNDDMIVNSRVYEYAKRKHSENMANRIITDETRKRMSVAAKKRSSNIEWRKQVSERMKLATGENNPFYGKHHSEETRQLISSKLKGKLSGENNPFYGKQHSDKFKEEHSKRMKGRNISDEQKEKQSKTISSLKWYNNGTKNIRAKECPEGFVPGRLYFKRRRTKHD